MQQLEGRINSQILGIKRLNDFSHHIPIKKNYKVIMSWFHFFLVLPSNVILKCLVSCCILRSQMFISNQSDLLSSTGCRYKDNNRNCPSWKARGYCTHTYQEYMRRNCQKSCFCGTSELIFSLTCPVYQISRVQSVCCLSFNNYYKYFTWNNL